MILSEFTGCTRTIASAIRINPWQIDYVASAMDRVINTSTDSISERWARDNNYLSQHSLSKWAREFLCDLRRARKAGSKVYMQCGFASTFRVVSMNENFRTLIPEDVIKAYRNAKRRMLFFDHEVRSQSYTTISSGNTCTRSPSSGCWSRSINSCGYAAIACYQISFGNAHSGLK